MKKKCKILHFLQYSSKVGVTVKDEQNNTKVFRSLIKKYFPVELLIQLDMIAESYDIDNNTKTADIIELLNKYNVPFSPLGNGTNRYGILIDGYAVKIALDRMGKIDNKREFKYVKKLYPYVVKVYECLETGLIAVTEYITIFSLDDFYDNQEEMRKILKDISSNFLVGDIGVSTDNYVNWGIRSDGSIAILDFAYIYSLSYKGFKCTCEDEGTLSFDNDYNYLICPFCRKKWEFSDIRKRITKQDEKNEIGDIMILGYVLEKDEEIQQIDPLKTPRPKDEKKKKKKKKHRVIIKKDKNDYDFDDTDQMQLLELLEKGLNDNGKKEK